MSYSVKKVSGLYWLVHSENPMKLVDFSHSEERASNISTALNLLSYVKSVADKIDTLDELDALDNRKAMQKVSDYNQLLCEIRDKAEAPN